MASSHCGSGPPRPRAAAVALQLSGGASMCMRRRFGMTVLGVAALASLLAAATPGRASVIIDQASAGPVGSGANPSFAGNAPLGQEFKPTLSSLDFVDLVLGDL